MATNKEKDTQKRSIAINPVALEAQMMVKIILK